MKKFLIFMSFLFAVACYAAPPPVHVPDKMSDHVQYVVPGEVISVQAVQEVAFVYLGDNLIKSSGQQENMDITELCCITHQEATIMNSIRKPLRLNTNPVFTNLNKVCTIDLKHSNYIYPFGGNYRS